MLSVTAMILPSNVVFACRQSPHAITNATPSHFLASFLLSNNSTAHLHQGSIARANANLAVFEKFVAENDWIDFLAEDPSIRSNTSVCLKLALTPEQTKEFAALLDKEGVGGMDRDS